VISDVNGLATSPLFTANAVTGNYQVVVSVSGSNAQSVLVDYE